MSPPAVEKASGKLRRAEDRHRANRDHAQAQVGAGQGLAVGHRGIDADLLPLTLAHDVGEHLHLAAGATTLTFGTAARQAAFAGVGIDQLVADTHDLVCDSLEKRGALLVAGRAIGVERRICGLAGCSDIFGPMDGEGVAMGFAGFGNHGTEFCH